MSAEGHSRLRLERYQVFLRCCSPKTYQKSAGFRRVVQKINGVLLEHSVPDVKLVHETRSYCDLSIVCLSVCPAVYLLSACLIVCLAISNICSIIYHRRPCLAASPFW